MVGISLRAGPYRYLPLLARRLIGRQHDYLRLTTDFRAAPGNNGSERDIRMAKLLTSGMPGRDLQPCPFGGRSG